MSRVLSQQSPFTRQAIDAFVACGGEHECMLREGHLGECLPSNCTAEQWEAMRSEHPETWVHIGVLCGPIGELVVSFEPARVEHVPTVKIDCRCGAELGTTDPAAVEVMQKASGRMEPTLCRVCNTLVVPDNRGQGSGVLQ